MHNQRFPGETAAYRTARDELLRAERELRRQVEAVAAQRRRMPLGGVVPTDYVFEAVDLAAEGDAAQMVRLSELFPEGRDALALYNFMYGPKMSHACPMCSSFLDGLNGNARHLSQRIGLAVVARSNVARIRDHARSRGWDHLRLLSSANNDYNRDYHGEDPDGAQNPMMTIFVRRGGAIHHFWSSELQCVAADPGQNQRHLDPMWPLWNVLDLTPEGRGEWYPAL